MNFGLYGIFSGKIFPEIFGIFGLLEFFLVKFWLKNFFFFFFKWILGFWIFLVEFLALKFILGTFWDLEFFPGRIFFRFCGIFGFRIFLVEFLVQKFFWMNFWLFKIIFGSEIFCGYILGSRIFSGRIFPKLLRFSGFRNFYLTEFLAQYFIRSNFRL